MNPFLERTLDGTQISNQIGCVCFYTEGLATPVLEWGD